MRKIPAITATFVVVLGACAAACSSDSGPEGAGGSSASAGAAGAGVGGSGGFTSAGSSAGGAPSGGASSGGAGGTVAGSGGAGEPTAGTSPSGGNGGAAGASSAGTGNGGSAGNAGASGAGGSGGTAGTGGSPATGPTTVWIAGDSTVQTCSGACPCGWGGEFDALFNDRVTVVNRAVGGRSIQTWLREPAVSNQKTGSECTLTSQAYNARWTGMLDATSGMKPGDTLLIQFGINDGDSSCPRHVGTALYETYLGDMAKAAKERGAQAIFVTPTSAIECSGSTAVATRGFLTTIKSAAAKNGVPVIDLHQLSIDLYNKLGLCPNNGNYSTGKVGEFFCDDHTHFDKPGARQIAQVVASALKAQGLPLAGYLK